MHDTNNVRFFQPNYTFLVAKSFSSLFFPILNSINNINNYCYNILFCYACFFLQKM